MDTLHRCCAGLDVHQKSIAACIRRVGKGGRIEEEVRTFGTMTAHLLELSDWMSERGVTHVAMESTGVLWKPVFNILEGVFEVLLVNARHIKQVPGRKTDIKDCQWIAQLLQCGLLKASYIPDRAQRQLRDLTRQRTQLKREHNRVANRIHKVLEDANIKLAAVITDILGVSGRAMIRSLIEGEQDSSELAELAHRRMRGKIPQLREALRGNVTEHHRFLLRLHMDHVQHLESQIDEVDQRIGVLVAPFVQKIERLLPVPGLDRVVIHSILAEIGTDMSAFPTEHHLASWGGFCPGNHESAGKRGTGRTTNGNCWLRATMSLAAWGASHTKGSYFHSQYRRLAARRGKKRAIMAVAHSLLVVVYHILRDDVEYTDLGVDYFDRLEPYRQARYHITRLKQLGYDVTLPPKDEAA